MREIRSYGSVRGVPGNRHSYRDPKLLRTVIYDCAALSISRLLFARRHSGQHASKCSH
jgi:hypothetical protein